MLFLNAKEVQESLPMPQAVEAMNQAFLELETGGAPALERAVFSVPPDRGDFMIMPSILGGGATIGTKLLTLIHGNPEAGRPLMHALMTVFDGQTGEPQAIMDGGVLTATRTGAVSGAATDFLARPDAKVVAIIGAGRQGRTQLEGVCSVREIKQVYAFDAIPHAAESFASDMAAKLGIPVEAVPVAGEAVARADIVCTATSSGVPVFSDEDVRPGTHINAIGCYLPDRHEIPPETVARAKVVVDETKAAKEEAGDIVVAVERGLMDWDNLYAEFQEIVAGKKTGRETPEEITLFKSVGLPIQDLAAANCALENARRLGLGTRLA